MPVSISNIIESAINRRAEYIVEPYEAAFRLLNGFSEDVPHLAIDIYAKTVVCHDYLSETHEESQLELKTIIDVILEKLPWIQAVIVKKRRSKDAKERNGQLFFGKKIDKIIVENDVRYAIDLTMNQDASFYLDTRGARKWVKENLFKKTVLNCFAYTGSLGIAALMGGAKEVMQLDLNGSFLTIAKRSALLNRRPVQKNLYQIGDFWSRIEQYKKSGKTFDCVILDPPVYAKTPKGIIDLANNYDRVINKVRPIINHGGTLVSINNALFQSGEEHHQELLKLCKDGYLSVEKLIDIPADCIGNAQQQNIPANPLPYNHSTKITILKVKKKNP